MARPRKCRRVCAAPNYPHFGPKGGVNNAAVDMQLDEYEAIRLIDFEGLTQEECALQMGVARTTVQAIYAAARKKMAECLVAGRQLVISGGDIQFCEQAACTRKRGCCRQGAPCEIHRKESEHNE